MAGRSAPRRPGALDDLKSDPTLVGALLPDEALPRRRRGAGAPARPAPEVPDERRRYTYYIGKALHQKLESISRKEQVALSDVARYAFFAFIADYEADGPLTRDFRRRRYQPPGRGAVRLD